MFCSNCGKADQKENTYCRNCGEFLVDSTDNLNLILKLFGISTTEKQVTVNFFISFIVLLLTATLLGFLMGYYRAGEDKVPPVETPTVIYFVYAFLLFISLWQVLNLIFAANIRKKFTKKNTDKKRENLSEIDEGKLHSAKTQEFLPTAKINPIENRIIREQTTKALKKRPIN
ncbi:MAG TPA: zinc ribbon domain-containing protein [Pyrinomonadaceae bacterium]|nr:zinc ribbon domain-containing protein [Pyrinomonadaceae bacterium]